MLASARLDGSPQSSRSRGRYVAIVATGFLLRLAFMLWHKTYIQAPNGIYPYAMETSSIAAHLASGLGFSSPFLHDTGPTAWIAPLYPLFVAGVFKAFGVYTNASALIVLGIQCFISGLTGAAICALGRRTLGGNIGLWAAWVWAISPFFFRWSVSWIWDFAASALLLAVILVLTLDIAAQGARRDWLLLGFLWGVTALTNPALLSILPFSFGYAFISDRDPRRRQHVLLSAMLCMIVISPWAIRNELVFGRPVFLRSNFWFEFHLGNYHNSNGMGYMGFHPGSNPRELRTYIDLGEQGYVRLSKQQAMSFVRQYPREFLVLTLHRTLWFWDGTSLLYMPQEWWQPWEFWPFSLAAWLGLLLVWMQRPRGSVLYSACLIVYPLPYYFVYPVAKYRHAIEPEMLLLSVFLASMVWSKLRKLRARKDRLPMPQSTAADAFSHQ